MKYCQYCGSEVQTTDLTCSNCGGKLSNNVSNQKVVAEDTGGFGWGLLGFCIPLAGLILFLVWNNERPKTAKSAGLGALISVGAYVLMYVFFIIIYLVAEGFN